MSLSWNRYGKSGIRLVKVRETEDGHDVLDLTIDVQLEGEFEPVYVEGDNRSCLATDTMKNTVYAFARQQAIEHVEVFGTNLAAHFGSKPGVSLVRFTITEQSWQRVAIDGRPQPHAFTQPGGEQWTTVVTRDAAGTAIVSGLANLVVMKTAKSAFSGFPRDQYTTLPETEDRILATSVTATWRYRPGTSDFAARIGIRRALLETFAGHDSRSVQHTLYAMGEAALKACADVTEITLSLPNRHHVLVDLAPFGLDNPNEIFVATDRPFGLIEATIRRETT